MESLIRDLRYALRSLLRRPSFTAIAVITLALGIGANTAIFSVVNAVLLRPLPFRHPEQLVTLWERNPKQGYEQNAPAAGNFVDWRDQNQVFAQMAIYAPKRFNLAFGDSPERMAGAAVSTSLFDLLGVSSAEGRIFSSEEEQPGRDQVVIISHRFRQNHFAANQNPVGETITLDGRNYAIVGVMPEGFQFPGGTGTVLRTFTAAPADLWVPLVLDAETLRQRSSHSLSVIGRLKPGVTVAQATAEMDAIQQRLQQQYPTFFIGSNVTLVPLAEQVVGAARRPVLVLWGAVAFVLLISCANIANLLLSRAASRKKEIALRAALGAGRGRMIRQLLTESLLLSIFGGVAGTLLAAWGVRALSAIVPANFPRRDEISIDAWVLGFTLLISILTGVIFGLAPALNSSRIDLTEALKAGGRNATAGAQGHRLRSLLVIVEMGLALILLVGASLMIQSFLHLQQVSPGFKTDHRLAMEISLPANSYPRAQRPAFFEQLLERTRSLPGVEAIAAAKHLPLSGDNMNFAFDIEGRPFPAGKSPGADCRFVTPDYFNAMAIPLIQGRVFSEGDAPQSPHVLIINERMARRFFPNEDPIGKRLVLGINNFTGQIVGIVADVKHIGLDAEANEEIYVAYSQAPFWTDMNLIVKTSGDPMSVVGSIRNELGNLDRHVPIGKVRTMETIAAESVAQPRFRTLLLSLFGIVALLLASVGIYGVMSYAVAQRTQEIGIRLALGAQIRDVRRMVITHGMTMAVIGVASGVAGAFVLTRLIASLLFEVAPTDVATFAGVSIGLVAAALVACYVPARRASRVDPLVALRYE
jgi:putative ABC transport system permease protein